MRIRPVPTFQEYIIIEVKVAAKQINFENRSHKCLGHAMIRTNLEKRS